MITLYKSLVRSILEFNSPVWNPTKIGEIQPIEGVQKTFTSRISASKDDDYWKRLQSSRDVLYVATTETKALNYPASVEDPKRRLSK